MYFQDLSKEAQELAILVYRKECPNPFNGLPQSEQIATVEYICEGNPDRKYDDVFKTMSGSPEEIIETLLNCRDEFDKDGNRFKYPKLEVKKCVDYQEVLKYLYSLEWLGIVADREIRARVKHIIEGYLSNNFEPLDKTRVDALVADFTRECADSINVGESWDSDYFQVANYRHRNNLLILKMLCTIETK